MPVSPNARVLSGFLDYLKIERGLARNTITAYNTDLLQFAEFLEARGRVLASAKREDVRDFIQQLFSHQVDSRSVGRKLSALRHLYRYLLLDRLIDHDPTLNIDSPKQWKVLPKSLARDEIETLMENRSTRGEGMSPVMGSRDHAMLEVFYAGALRVSELI